jgi:hypothetical protein
VVDVDHHHEEAKTMQTYLSVSEVARRLRCRPRDVSDLFYQRLLSDEDCPIIGGRRVIRADFVPVIGAALRRRARNEADEGEVR